MSTSGRLGFGDIVPKSALVQEWDVARNEYLDEGYYCEIRNNWEGKKFADHGPIKISMKWHFERMMGKPHKRVIRVRIFAPFIDDPDPPNEMAGICPGLWNYECVELFFANNKGQYTEVEVGPHGHWLVLLHKGYRECINNGQDLQLEVENEWKGSEWHCMLEIPLAYLPANITKFNAFAIHGSGDSKHFESLYTVTDGTFKEPDFHRLEFFGNFDTRRIIPSDYNRQPFDDMKYENLWAEGLKED